MRYNYALILLIIILIISIICFIFFVIKLCRFYKPKHSEISGGENPKPEDIKIIYNCDFDPDKYNIVASPKIMFITENVIFKYINYIILKLTNVINEILEIGKEQAEDIKENKYDSIHFENDNVKQITLSGDAFDKDEEVSFNLMFANCPNLETVILKNTLKNIKITNLAGMFYNCSNLKVINGLENLNTEKVVDMGGMFRGCTSLETINFGDNFDTKNVKYMDELFYECSNLNKISGFKNMNIARSTILCNMFYNCSALETVDFDENTQAGIKTEYDNKPNLNNFHI